MDAKAPKLNVERHRSGVIIRMTDGASDEIPHRDDMWCTLMFSDGKGKGKGRNAR